MNSSASTPKSNVDTSAFGKNSEPEDGKLQKPETRTRNIVIIGGGIIGCTTTYYLSEHPLLSNTTSREEIKVTLLESNHPASGASGKAGGLVARWAYPRSLVDVSFEEHQRLAKKLDGERRWGWREVECGRWEGRGIRREAGARRTSTVVDGEREGNGSNDDGTNPIPKIVKGLNEDDVQRSKDKKTKQTKEKHTTTGHPSDLDWIDEDLTESYEDMSVPGSGDTAQVHPYLFTNAMLNLALRNPRVQFIQGRVDSIEYAEPEPELDSDSSPATSNDRKTQRRQRRVKGIRYTRTEPGGGGGCTYAPPIPSFEEGVLQFSTESVSADSAGSNPTNPTNDLQEEGTEEVGEEFLFLPADQILLAAGPWSGALLEDLPIVGTRAHSITVRPPLKSRSDDGDSKAIEEGREREEISPYALFTSIEMPPSGGPKSPTRRKRRTSESIVTPEIYARPNQEVYICGGTDEEPLPPMRLGTKGVQVKKESCEVLFEQISSISPILAQGEITARQACYLPTPTRGPSGSPIIGEVEGVKGLYVATGHTCWGICNAPGTAKVTSELILDGEVKCCKIGGMLPARFMH